MVNNSSSFAGRLRPLREGRMLSKTALAKKLGVSTTCVWNWEEGNTLPRLENLQALSEALDVPIDYLQSGADWDGLEPTGSTPVGTFVAPSLSEVIAEAKIRIAHVARISPDKVNVSLDY